MEEQPLHDIGLMDFYLSHFQKKILNLFISTKSRALSTSVL